MIAEACQGLLGSLASLVGAAQGQQRARPLGVAGADVNRSAVLD
jgi:hypothetical protein